MISKEMIRGMYPIKNLSDVAEFLDSRRRPITASNRVPGPYPYYGANGQQDSVADYIFDEPLILLAEDGGLFDQPDRGIAYAIEGKTWVNNHAHVLRARNDVNQGYLLRVLQNYDVSPWINGSTRAKLTKAGASKIQIPLPPLDKQKRIAAILDAADDLRAKRRESLAQLDSLLQSTFLDMFGDPVTNPMGWDVQAFSELVQNEDGKRVPVKKADRENMSGEYPYYGASGIIDAVDDYLFDGERLLVGEDGENLVARSTPVAFIAKGKFWVNNHAHVLAFNGSAELMFLEATINLVDLKPYLSGSAQPKLNQKNLNRIPIAVPPLDEQRKYVAVADSIEQQKEIQRAHLDELDTLFASLQSRAFKGEL